MPVICPECKAEMEMYGVFESGEWKFCCVECSRQLSMMECYLLKTKAKDLYFDEGRRTWLSGK